jgi:hypothetical protein
MPELSALPNLSFAHLAGIDSLTIANFIVPELRQSGISKLALRSCPFVSPLLARTLAQRNAIKHRFHLELAIDGLLQVKPFP